MVPTYHKYGDISRRGKYDDHSFSSTLQVCPSLLHSGQNTIRLHNIPSISIASFNVGMISILEDGDGIPTFPMDDKFPILSHNCPMELAVGRGILGHVDHIVEVSVGVIDSKNIYFARVGGSPDNQAHKNTKFNQSNLHHHVSGKRLALHAKIWLSLKREEAGAYIFKTKL